MRYWGIDIGSTALKAVEITRSWQGTRVTRCEIRPFSAEGNRREFTRQAIQEIFPPGDRRGKAIFLCVPSHRTMVRRRKLPFQDRRRNLKVVKFEAEPLLPLPIEEILVDFYPIREKGEGEEALIFAVPKRDLEETLSLLQGVGIEPEAVIPEAAALFSMVKHSGEEISLGPGALLDMGQEKNTLIVWEKGRLAMTRSIPLLSYCSRDATLPSGGWAAPLLHRLADEVKRSLLSYESIEGSGRIERIWISGGGAYLPEVGSILTEKTGRSAEPFRLEQHSSFMLREVPAEEPMVLAAAIGAALFGSSGEADQLNLRQEEFTSGGKIQKEKNRLKLLVAYGIILIGIAIGAFGTRLYLKEKKYQELKAEVRQEFVQANPGVKKIVNEVQQMRNRLQEEKARLMTMGGLIGGGAPLEILRDLSILTEPGWKIRVTELTIAADTVELSGEADSFDAVNRFKAALEQLAAFKAVQLKTARSSTLENVVEFKLEIARRGEA